MAKNILSTTGKIATADKMLQSGKYSKLQVAEALAVKFEVPIKTAINTVYWSAATMMERKRRKSKHKPIKK